MFAGAAREAVFSHPDVVRRVPREFVPVALKAALVNHPPAGPEGRFLREIGRSKPAPQGICAANPAGKVLAWSLSFDDPGSVPKFLDHVLERQRRFPDDRRPVVAKRYMKFPSQALSDVPDTRVKLPEVSSHAVDGYCPATPPKVRGTVAARLWGRVVEKDGTLAADCRSQESYVEDRFDIPPDVQAELARAVARGAERFRVPESFARLLATHAYLGQLDVRPLSSPVPHHRGKATVLELWARRVEADEGVTRLEISGRSEVEGTSPGRRGDGASYHHEIRLDWQGSIDVRGERVTDLVLHAAGREKLRWGNPRFVQLPREDDVTRLPAGRPLDIDTDVRYGVTGRPVAGKEVWKGDRPPPVVAGGGPPPGLRAKLERLEQGMRRLARSGGDTRPVEREVRRFQDAMRSGKRANAEAALDRGLRRLEGGSDRELPPDASEVHREIRRELRRLRHQIERLEGLLDELSAGE
ncbi:MAG: hypothetical protein O7J95_00150 [Planctomycetota bacterium]|nr:hypothetical protein [Planctomycetota bacterium]